jgi:hypothetical protein
VLGGRCDGDRFLFGSGYDTNTITDFKDDAARVDVLEVQLLEHVTPSTCATKAGAARGPR